MATRPLLKQGLVADRGLEGAVEVVVLAGEVPGLILVDSGSTSATLARGDAHILLRRATDPPPVDRRIVHINLEVSDVHAVYEELRAKGVEFVHRPRVVSQGEQLELWAATFRDPDGHAIALTRWELRR